MKTLLRGVLLFAILTIFSLNSFAQSWEYLSNSISELYYHSSFYSDDTDIYMVGQKDSITDLNLLEWNSIDTDWDLVSTAPINLDARFTSVCKHPSGKFVVSFIEVGSYKFFMYLYDSDSGTWSELISPTVNNQWNSSSVYDTPSMAVDPVTGNIGIAYISFQSANGTYAPVVLEFDGTTLSLMGTGNPRAVLTIGSSEWTNNISLAYTADGDATVIFGARNNAIGPFVVSFDGTAWIDKGGISGFAIKSNENRIVTNSADEVFVSFNDNTNSSTVLLKTTDFSTWTSISSYPNTSPLISLSKLKDGKIYQRLYNTGYIIDGLDVINFTGSSAGPLPSAKMFNYLTDEYLLFGNWQFAETRTYRYHLIPQVPTVTTQAVTNIDGTTATGNGNTTNLGVPNPIQYGICWNTTGNPTIDDSKTTEGAISEVGAFTSDITGLTDCQLYYVRAYATNSTGTSYGNEVSFNTLDITSPSVPSLSELTDECSLTAIAPTTSDNCAGTITGTTTDLVEYMEQGTYTITWNFDDGSGNSVDVEQTVVIGDVTNPSIPSLAELTDECSLTAIAPTTSDNCAGTITGTTTDPIEYMEQGTYTITWNFDDGNGNSVEVEQTVVIGDITNPAIPSLVDLTDECSLTAIAPTTSDNCVETITGTTTDPLEYMEQGTYTITWNFDDGNGNSIDVEQTVIVGDLTEPVISCSENQTFDLNEGETFYTVQGTEFNPLSVEDNCEVGNTLNDFNDTSTLENAQLPVGTTTIVWTVTDVAENTSNCTLEITVNPFVVSTKDIALSGISIYPNPTSGMINFDLSKVDVQRITISDISGKVVMEKTRLNQQENIDLSNCSSGIYFVNIQTDNNVITAKIIKE